MELIINSDFSEVLIKDAILDLPENEDYNVKVGINKKGIDFIPEIDPTITGPTITGVLLLAFQIFNYVRNPSKYKNAKNKIKEIIKPLSIKSFEIKELKNLDGLLLSPPQSCSIIIKDNKTQNLFKISISRGGIINIKEVTN